MRPTKAALIALALLLALAPLALSCAEINFAPLFHYRTTPEGFDLTVAGPLVEHTQGFTAIRPLYYQDDNQKDYLYPLGHSTDKKSYFAPFMRSSEEKDEDSTDVLLYSRGTYQGESYGGLFPFYGTYVNRFGHDRLTYVLWPAYSKAMDDGAETTTIMWPFLKYSEGREFQLWPLYGHVRKANSDDRYVLWPFLFRKRGVEDYDAFLPFYSHTRGRNHLGVSVIWPFFTYNRNTSPQLTSLSCPWPLVRYATGAYEEREFFPFYWSMIDGDEYRMKIVLWPLYWHTTSYDGREDVREEHTRILLLSGTSRKTREQGLVSSSATVWPVWHRQGSPYGSSWCFPWIIPLNDGGFWRNWLPLLTLAQGSRDGPSSEVSVLWRTLFYTRDENSSRLSLSFLFSWERGTGYRRIGFLSDLVHWTWGRPGAQQDPPQSQARGDAPQSPQ
jgi:hypothetical protein